MATVINNPPSEGTGSNAMGMAIGVIAVILLIIFLIYGLPRLMGGTQPQTSNTPETSNTEQSQAPESQSESGVNIDVPEQVDVNVNSN